MPTKILIELHYLPCIQYFTKLMKYETVYIEQFEHYQKGAYRNRCHVSTANNVQQLSIPLGKGKNEQQLITEVTIAHQIKWQHQHWTSIKSAYGRAPYWEFYSDYLSPFFHKKYKSLFDLNWDLLEQLIELLQLEVDLKKTTDYNVKPSEMLDFRNAIHPNLRKRKVDPHFAPKPYNQVFEERTGFLPNLTILDLLFCTGPQAQLILEASFKE